MSAIRTFLAQCDQILRNLAKNLKSLAIFLKVYLIFGKVVNPLWDYLYTFRQNFIFEFHFCKWPSNEKQSGHLVTLLGGYTVTIIVMSQFFSYLH